MNAYNVLRGVVVFFIGVFAMIFFGPHVSAADTYRASELRGQNILHDTALPIPEGTHIYISPTLCASDGFCPEFPIWVLAYYYVPLTEIVMKYPLGVYFTQHEICHAHQHWIINEGAPDTSYILWEWYFTDEGWSFYMQFGEDPWFWYWWQSEDGPNAIEDFAWTCAYWYLNKDALWDISPARYEWAEQWLP